MITLMIPRHMTTVTRKITTTHSWEGGNTDIKQNIRLWHVGEVRALQVQFVSFPPLSPFSVTKRWRKPILRFPSRSGVILRRSMHCTADFMGSYLGLRANDLDLWLEKAPVTTGGFSRAAHRCKPEEKMRLSAESIINKDRIVWRNESQINILEEIETKVRPVDPWRGKECSLESDLNITNPPTFKHRLTIITMTMEPVNIRDSLVFSGKYGSLTPVTGFSSMVGAMAANSGRGRSWGDIEGISIIGHWGGVCNSFISSGRSDVLLGLPSP